MAKSKDRKASKKNITVLISVIIIFVSAIISMMFPDIFAIKNNAIDAADDAKIKVHFIDVGQGDSVLLEADGSFALIDAGDISSKQQLTAYLKQAKVSTLDYLIISHGHADHIGSMDAVVNNFDVKKILMPQFDKAPLITTSIFERLLDLIDQKNIPTQIMETGNNFKLGSGNIEIVTDGIKTNNQNNISPYIKFSAQGLVYLGAGDAEKEAEKIALKQKINVKANVFKASHHGSSTSNTKKFLSAISPKVVVISCGIDNDFNHPHKDVVKSLEEIKTNIYRTDKNGTVIAYIDENGELAVALQKGE